MDDMEKFISELCLEVSSKAAFSGVEYKDEPIIRPASGMKNYMPPRYDRMKAIARENGYNSFEAIFYLQAKFMEDFEDNYDFKGDFFRYFPTYSSMNDTQLRGYFSWRTKVRHGTAEKTCPSFWLVYMYELLNGIGVSDPEDGYHKLKKTIDEYYALCDDPEYYPRRWLKDYVVYYGLDKSLLNDNGFVSADDALSLLLNRESKSDEEVFDAINLISGRKGDSSVFRRDHPDDVNAVVRRSYDELEKYYDKNRAHSLTQTLFGNMTERHYRMFEFAVFSDRSEPGHREYEMSDICRFCKRGTDWTCAEYTLQRQQNKLLSQLLKGTDYLMRLKYGYKKQIKKPEMPSYLEKTISGVIDALLLEKEEAKKIKIEIDFGKLGGIRAAAEITREKLIVEEEPEEDELPLTVSEEVPEEPDVCDSPLDGTERGFMRLLTEGKPYGDFLRSRNAMLSVVVDSVNEKLFDIFGDTVILFDGDTPELIEEYTEELKEYI